PGSRLMVDDGAREVLDRQQGRTLPTDQQTEVASPEMQVDGVLVGPYDLDVGLDAELRRELGQELPGDPSLLLQCNFHVTVLPLLAATWLTDIPGLIPVS